VATGVEFAVEGRTFTVEAVKEVILSVGTVQTPQILELSGEYFLSFFAAFVLTSFAYSYACFSERDRKKELFEQT